MSWKSEDLDAVNCDFCGSDENQLVIQRPDGLSAVECRKCGLCFLNPRPKEHLIARLYEAEYFSKSNPNTDSAGIGYPDYLSDSYRRQMLKTNRVRLEVALPYLKLRGSRCLEIGCATGEFCELLRAQGAAPLGIDLSAHAISCAKERYPKVSFQTGEFASLPPEHRFDAIFAFELIEHVTSPKRFFAEAARRLNPGGSLVLSTPNFDCGRSVGPARWTGFLISFEHLYFFSPSSLAAYGRAAKLELGEWFADGDPGVPPPQKEPKKGLRKLSNEFLHKTHLIGPAVALRERLRGVRQPYVPRGTGHNLFMIFKKAC